MERLLSPGKGERKEEGREGEERFRELWAYPLEIAEVCSLFISIHLLYEEKSSCVQWSAKIRVPKKNFQDPVFR